jgi:predicted nucleotidyltransferase
VSLDHILTARLRERDDLLGRIVTLLESDERVVAAWLHGSLGRGEGDVWSDLDVWVVVANGHMAATHDTKREYAAKVGESIIIVDAPNAPPGGDFLSVVYGGYEGGPQHVDWTWQPGYAASVPPNVRVLFTRGDLPQAPPAREESRDERIARARHQISYFWMMVPIVAKYIARRRAWDVLELMQMVGRTVDEVKELVGTATNGTGTNVRSELLPLSQPMEQLALLRQLAAEMEALMSGDEALMGVVSTEGVGEIRSLLGEIEKTLPSKY